MSFSLSASVGIGGVNKPIDVKTIQINLNRIPEEKGGPSIPLDADSTIGPKTTSAIGIFQKRHFSWSDGRIVPNGQTHKRMEEVLSLLPATPDVGLNGNSHSTPNSWPSDELRRDMKARVLSNLPSQVIETGAETWLDSLSPARMTIIDVAVQEARPYPGKVSDMEGQTSLSTDPWDGKLKRIRHGWRRLEEYFRTAQVFVDMNIVTEREGILCWNKRVQKNKLPQAENTTPGIHWCGIFATWVYINAQRRWPNFHHRPLRWMSPLISMPKLVALENGGKIDVNPGDVAVILKNTHHFTVISPPFGSPPKVWTVSGNDEYQSILIKTFPLSLILMRYSGDDIFL